MNHLLTGMNRKRVAVIENELGEISIDHQLVLRTDLGTMETVQGRTCCTAREEFMRLLYVIAHARANYDRLLIETTGVAHPGMVAHAILGDQFLGEYLRLDGVVTVVDAKHVLAHLGQDGHADEQVAYADLLVVNKTDLVSKVELDHVLSVLEKINGSCARLLATDANVPAGKILNIGGFDLKRIENGVGGCSQSNKSPKKSDKATHSHDIETVSVSIPGELDSEMFRDWLQAFVAAHALDLFRCKGIVAIRDIPARLIFQGVHGMFRMTLGQPWAQDERVSQAVFIGRGLDRKEITTGLERCRVNAYANQS